MEIILHLANAWSASSPRSTSNRVCAICGTLLEEDPGQYENIYFGAWASLHVDDRYAERMLEEWAV